MNTTPCESSKCRRAVLFVIAVCLMLNLLSLSRALAAQGPPGAGGDSSQQRQAGKEVAGKRNPQPVYRQSRFRRFKIKLKDFLQCHLSNRMKKEELLMYGPQLKYGTDSVSIQALVKGGSMMIEYEMETQSTATITIRVMNEAPFTRTFSGDGMGKIRSESFDLPHYRNDKPQPGLISIKAARRGPGGSLPTAFDLLAIGNAIGPKPFTTDASGRHFVQVASLGGLRAVSTSHAVPLPRASRSPWADRLNLYDITFKESQGDYIYSFNVGDRFDRWGLQVLKHRGRLRPLKVRESLYEEAIGPYLNTLQNHWDGLNDDGRRVRPGKYKVLVSVWDSSGDASWDIAKRADWLDSSLIEIK
jgi:hypothetical protein